MKTEPEKGLDADGLFGSCPSEAGMKDPESEAEMMEMLIECVLLRLLWKTMKIVMESRGWVMPEPFHIPDKCRYSLPELSA